MIKGDYLSINKKAPGRDELCKGLFRGDYFNYSQAGHFVNVC